MSDSIFFFGMMELGLALQYAVKFYCQSKKLKLISSSYNFILIELLSGCKIAEDSLHSC